MYKSHLTSGVHIFSQEKDKKCSVSENCPNLSREHYWKAMDLELIWNNVKIQDQTGPMFC